MKILLSGLPIESTVYWWFPVDYSIQFCTLAENGDFRAELRRKRDLILTSVAANNKVNDILPEGITHFQPKILFDIFLRIILIQVLLMERPNWAWAKSMNEAVRNRTTWSTVPLLFDPQRDFVCWSLIVYRSLILRDLHFITFI